MTFPLEIDQDINGGALLTLENDGVGSNTRGLKILARGLSSSVEGIRVQVNNGVAIYARATSSSGLALVADGAVDIKQDLTVKGAKNFVMPHPFDETKEIIYTSLEGPEAGTYFRGTGRLDAGEVIIELPEHFAFTTSSEALITVQVTPRQECEGLYVVEATPEFIVIREMKNGTSNAEFDFFIQGVRAGYEDNEVIRDKRDVRD